MVLIALGLAQGAAAQSAAQDLITSLPGAEGMGFTNQYSGYLDLPGTEKHGMFWCHFAAILLPCPPRLPGGLPGPVIRCVVGHSVIPSHLIMLA